MRVSRAIVWASLIAIVASSFLYLSPMPPLVFNAVQMNDLLVAIFGAGIGSLVISLIEHHSNCKELEESLFENIEPLISALAELKECTIESIPDVKYPQRFLKEFYEEQSNCLAANPLFPSKNEKRDKLIQAIEKCPLGECERYLNNKESSFRRYLSRMESYLDESVISYLNLDKKMIYIVKLLVINQQMAYLFPVISRKNKIIKEINNKLIEIKEKYNSIIGSCRLYKDGNYERGDLLNDFVQSESIWSHGCMVSLGGREINVVNRDAYALFTEVFAFAKAVHSPHLIHYEGIPWWCQ